mgnify:CR=1 FL=1
MSKIGLHIVPGPRTGFGAFLTRLRDANAVSPSSPLVLKMVGDFGPAQEAKTLLGADRVLAIGRKSGEGWEGLDVHASGGTPPRDVAALHFQQVYKPIIDLNPAIDVWEPCNEWSAHWSWQADFYIELMPLFEALGKRMGMFAFSTGNPPLEASTAIARACAAAKQRNAGHLLTSHEYGGVGVSIPTLRDTQPFHALRYHALYQVLREQGAIIPLVISEAGQNGGFQFIGTDALVEDFAWYDTELFKNSYVIGCASWTLGKWNDGASNVQSALPALADYMIAHPTPAPPVDEPLPEPCRGTPRTPYKRRYIVIHPAIANREQYYAIAGLRQHTVGPSADDAGIGDLDMREVIVVQPDLWASDTAMREFYEQNYPGVIYHGVNAMTPSELDTWIRAHPL